MGTGEEKLDFTYVQDLINGIISCVVKMKMLKIKFLI